MIARRIVDELADHTDLRASLLAGSAAQGTSDEHSDIDLLNYYEELPNRSAFDEVMRAVGAEPFGDIGPPDREGFLARYKVHGVEVQTGAQLVQSIEERLDSISAGDVDWAVAKFAAGLLEGIAMHGDDTVRRWQERAAYPDSLRRREVQANLGFFPSWRIDDQLAVRDAELFRRQMLLDGAFRVVAVLSAINRLYFSSFQFKRAGAHIDQMKLKPDRLTERLDRVANAPPSEAAEELGSLVEETTSIVRSEMPDMDVAAPWMPPVDPSR